MTEKFISKRKGGEKIMRHEQYTEHMNLSGQQVIPRREAVLRNIWQFWNPQNHHEEYGERNPKPVKRRGDVSSILSAMESATSKRQLGRILHEALGTELTKDERKQVRDAMRQRKLQM